MAQSFLSQILSHPVRWMAVGAVALTGLGYAVSGRADEDAHLVVPPAADEQTSATSETVVLAGGCFWGVQGVFEHVKGVTKAVSGYAGGEAETAHYEMTSTGATGHAESVQVTFNPQEISYGHILQIYFSVAHDPTELNRQGPDSGTQYRSTIFPASDEQAQVAQAYIDQLDQMHAFGAKIATTIEPGKTFYPAETYHQDYLVRNPHQPYIVFNDLPKVSNLKEMFPTEYRTDPVLVLAGPRAQKQS
ncbi:MAG TPA: peptide-methionine (S)-S-oxide reductase MsrA [Magnetospirillaceae bacterium]|jgi:peptide-methionine (S)-S-oxide reductase